MANVYKKKKKNKNNNNQTNNNSSLSSQIKHKVYMESFKTFCSWDFFSNTSFPTNYNKQSSISYNRTIFQKIFNKRFIIFSSSI